MKDKEKQIEEMAKVLCNRCLEISTNKKCPMVLFGEENSKLCLERRKYDAEYFYNAGYRKNRMNFADRIQLVKNAVETKLKQFAERLKEELEEYRLENEYFTEHEPNGNLWQMNSSVFCIEVTQDGGLVDETLKEFIEKSNDEEKL